MIVDNKLLLLQAVKKQIDAEVESDLADIEMILEHPDMIDYEVYKDKGGVAYALHEKYHHLAVHLRAQEELTKKIDEYYNYQRNDT